MRSRFWNLLFWLAAAAMTGLAWLGYRRPEMEFTWYGWIGLCT